MSILYETSREDLMSLRDDNDSKVNSRMTAIHGLHFRLNGSVEAVHERTQLPSATHPPQSDSGSADAPSSSGSFF